MHGDLESTSVVDLRKAGVYRYAEDKDTHILCASFKVAGEYFNWRPGMPKPDAVVEAIKQGAEFWAWNANFERVMWREHMVKRHGWPEVPDKQWRCTMVKAAVFGLPLSLDLCGKALGMGQDEVKSKDGHSLMMRMARPRAIEEDGKVRWWHIEEPLRLLDLVLYCQQDVVAESHICDLLGDMPAGWNWWGEWRLDQRVNDRGVPLDMDLIQRMQVMANIQKTRLDEAIKTVTGGMVERCSQRDKLLDWVRKRDPMNCLANLQAETLDGWLKSNARMAGTPVHEALALRAESAKSSVSKLTAMEACACADGRVRGGLQYYGANRTGRWAGRLVQWQNMPRPVIKAHEIQHAIDLILNRDLTVQQVLDGLGAFMGAAVMSVLSSLLRGCLAGVETGEWLGALDFAQIEARVLAWLAGQQDVLEVFANGEDIYTYAAKQQGSSDRQFGKVLTLALGFGMGWKKLIETAMSYGVLLGPDQAQRAVTLWRGSNDAIVGFWRACETAVKQLLVRKDFGKTYRVGKVRFSLARRKAGRVELRVQLPSGRQLVYQEPQLVVGPMGHSEVTYMGVNQYTRKWERLKTYGGKLVENIVQAVARDAMSWAMTVLERGGWEVLITIHDELLFRMKKAFGAAHMARMNDLADAKVAILRGLPPWLAGCPVDVDGYFDRRFRKG